MLYTHEAMGTPVGIRLLVVEYLNVWLQVSKS